MHYPDRWFLERGLAAVSSTSEDPSSSISTAHRVDGHTVVFYGGLQPVTAFRADHCLEMETSGGQGITMFDQNKTAFLLLLLLPQPSFSPLLPSLHVCTGGWASRYKKLAASIDQAQLTFKCNKIQEICRHRKLTFKNPRNFAWYYFKSCKISHGEVSYLLKYITDVLMSAWGPLALQGNQSRRADQAVISSFPDMQAHFPSAISQQATLLLTGGQVETPSTCYLLAVAECCGWGGGVSTEHFITCLHLHDDVKVWKICWTQATRTWTGGSMNN